MPDTQAWQVLLCAAHDWHEEVPVDVLDQIDTHLRQFAETLGFTLDRRTLEAGLWGIVAAIALACVFEEEEHPDTAESPSPENMRLGLVAARMLVVKRLEAIGAGIG
jgi:hypothetical protein